MAEVVGLDGVVVVPEAVDYDRGLVEILERALFDVKSGDVIGLGLIMIRAGETGDIDTNFQGYKLRLLAGACRLTHRLNVSCDETSLLIRS